MFAVSRGFGTCDDFTKSIFSHYLQFLYRFFFVFINFSIVLKISRNLWGIISKYSFLSRVMRLSSSHLIASFYVIVHNIWFNRCARHELWTTSLCNYINCIIRSLWCVRVARLLLSVHIFWFSFVFNLANCRFLSSAADYYLLANVSGIFHSNCFRQM